MSCESRCSWKARVALMCATWLALCAVSVQAAAQDVPDAAASALFREGRELIKQGHWDEGCPKLDASMKRFAAPSTLLNLALCREHEGRVATAWAMAQRARVLNRDTVGNRRERLDAAGEELIKRLEPRLPRLRVVVRPPLDGARITENERDLPLDTAVPLDPGRHEVVAKAPGRADVVRTVELREGETLAVEITFLAADPGDVTSDPREHGAIEAHNPAVEGALPAPTPVPAPEEAATSEVPIWVWVVGATGLALSGVAIAFSVEAVSAADALEERCGADLVCDEDLTFDPQPLNDEKNRSTALAIAFGSSGAIGIVAAVIGLATSGDVASATRSHRIQLGGWGTPRTFGVSARGTF